MHRRKVLVTGGTRGIGKAVAAKLAAEGAHVAIWGSDIDIADANRVKRAHDEMGDVDILVNNAGWFGPVESALTYPLEDWNRSLAVNLTGHLHVCQAFIPGMVKRGWGRVVNMSSVVAKDVNPLSPAYTCAKAGLVALTKCLGRELAKTGVTVNAVTPSACNTDLFVGVEQAYIEKMLAKVPMERFVTVEEIAAMVAFICSDACSGTTAAVFDVSGGRSQY